MKKIIVLILIMTMFANFNICIATSLDKSYIDLLYGKFQSYPDDIKETRRKQLRALVGSKLGLELLYREVLKSKKDSMEKYGLTESELRTNIDILKEWKASDRRDLIDALASGDRSKIDDINEKYAEDEDDDASVSSPTSSIPSIPSSNINVSTGVLDDTIKIKEKQISKLSKLKQKLKEKGFRVVSIAEKQEFKNKIFKDTLNHWSNKEVLFLAKRGIVKGTGDGIFNPNSLIKKAEIIALVNRVIIENKEKIVVNNDNIKDIGDGKWYDSDMRIAYSLGILNKDYLAKIYPEKEPYREEVVDIIVRAIKVMDIPISDELKKYNGKFKDYEQISPLKRENMNIAINLGIIKGDGENLKPRDKITRAEVAAIIKRFYEYIISVTNK